MRLGCSAEIAGIIELTDCLERGLAAASAVSVAGCSGKHTVDATPQLDMVEALAVPQGQHLGCIIACQISRGYFYSRPVCVRDSLLRTPDPAGDDEGCRPPAPGSWLVAVLAHHLLEKWWLDDRPARPMAAKSRASG